MIKRRRALTQTANFGGRAKTHTSGTNHRKMGRHQLSYDMRQPPPRFSPHQSALAFSFPGTRSIRALSSKTCGLPPSLI